MQVQSCTVACFHGIFLVYSYKVNELGNATLKVDLFSSLYVRFCIHKLGLLVRGALFPEIFKPGWRAIHNLCQISHNEILLHGLI